MDYLSGPESCSDVFRFFLATAGKFGAMRPGCAFAMDAFEVAMIPLLP
ncbi:MAG: hypothetical protein IJ523_10920 [Succinivibrionaceae bacterium]|nr:hypothetical protein [Succinivibrionaceae bacterium]